MVLHTIITVFKRAWRQLLLAGLMLIISVPSHADTARLGGTGAALGSLRLLADAYAKVDPQFTLDIVPNLGSNGGLKALAQDKIQIAVIARTLKADETKNGLMAHPYGKTPFILASSNKVPESLAFDQIANIYEGKQTKWGNGAPVRVVMRPANDTDTDILVTLSPGIKAAVAKALVREGLVVANTDQDSADALERLKGSLGTSTLAIVLSEKRALFAVPINGVTPSLQTMQNASYPYSKPFYLVTKAAPAGSLKGFLDFVRSDAGRSVLAGAGLWLE